MNLLEIRIAQHTSKLSDNDFQSLKSMNALYKDIPNMLMKELADSCYTSISTLHRTISKLGFSGFSDFKLRVNDDLKNMEETEAALFNEEEYLQNYLNDIKLTKRLNENVVKDVAEIILEKQFRFCFGTGWKQKQVIDNFSNDLLYYKVPFVSLRTENDLRVSANVMDETSVLIILSLSGNIDDYIEVLKACSIRNVTIISITSDKNNLLSSSADYALYYKEHALDNADIHWNINTLNFLTDYLIETIISKK